MSDSESRLRWLYWVQNGPRRSWWKDDPITREELNLPSQQFAAFCCGQDVKEGHDLCIGFRSFENENQKKPYNSLYCACSSWDEWAW